VYYNKFIKPSILKSRADLAEINLAIPEAPMCTDFERDRYCKPYLTSVDKNIKFTILSIIKTKQLAPNCSKVQSNQATWLNHNYLVWGVLTFTWGFLVYGVFY